MTQVFGGSHAAAAATSWSMPMRWVGVLATTLAALLGASEAGAAVLPAGLTSSSVGLLAALVTWLVFQAWPAPAVSDALLVIGAAAVCGAASVWLWRLRASPLKGMGSAAARPGRSARPAQASSSASLPAAASLLPPGLDPSRLLSDLRAHFVLLQAAWDAGEVSALRTLVTVHMLAQLCEVRPVGSAAENRTDVVTLHAELLGFEELGDSQLVTVEFSGLIRESAEHGAAPFRELWMLARPKHGARDWKLARQQALL